MSIMVCNKHDFTYDSDLIEGCPKCFEERCDSGVTEENRKVYKGKSLVRNMKGGNE